MQVKKRHASDARYSAVNSSSLRAQLFGKHLAALASGGAPSSSSKGTAAAPAPTTKEDKAARAAASLREREERVRAEKARAERSANVARGALGKEEAEREFAQLLIDAVRDHKVRLSAFLSFEAGADHMPRAQQARFEDLAPSLSRDPRFDGQALHPSDKRRLFEQHQQKLHRSRVADVEALFAAHSPRLTTPFHDVLPAISSDPHVSRLVGSDFDALEALYEQWLARRTQRAREDFSQMLRESPILEHWGRMRKLEKREKVALIGQEGTRNDESDDDEADTREMAEQIDLKAIHAVLKVRGFRLTSLFCPHLSDGSATRRTTSGTLSLTTSPKSGSGGSRSTPRTWPRPRRPSTSATERLRADEEGCNMQSVLDSCSFAHGIGRAQARDSYELQGPQMPRCGPRPVSTRASRPPLSLSPPHLRPVAALVMYRRVS